MPRFANPARPLAVAALALACHAGAGPAPGAAPSAASEAGTLAQVIYWRARPGKFDEYSRYIREVAEPIDEEARRAGAFLSITTYATRDTASAWTHMRVFVLRDSAQLAGLSAALDAAGRRLEPDSAKRAARGVYSATLRDRVATYVAQIVRR
ncbi:MAG: hypothetical protein U9Q74_12030 [Gemmatimonadota bacterium]|nr:hypothetical protein [Gemmatimonadota bacterium]